MHTCVYMYIVYKFVTCVYIYALCMFVCAQSFSVYWHLQTIISVTINTQWLNSDIYFCNNPKWMKLFNFL